MSWGSIGDDQRRHIFASAVLAHYSCWMSRSRCHDRRDRPPLRGAARCRTYRLGLDLVRRLFVGGWTFRWSAFGAEAGARRQPFPIFIAPIFLVAELFFALGLKRDVREKVEARLERGA